MTDLTRRDAREVFEDHLELARQGRLEEDIAKNYSGGCVLLTNRGTFHGEPGIRELADMLRREIPGAEYVYVNKLVAGRFAFLEWTADCGAVAVNDGADSFVIEDGRIVAQTIHYTLAVRDPKALCGEGGAKAAS